MANSYVLLDLVSINVTTISTDSGSTIVFCESINVKRCENQTINSVDDWSNIIIGDPKYNDYVYNNDDGSATIYVTYKDTDGSLQLYENIGLWSMILFTTKTDDVGVYTQLGDVIGGAADIGGSGTGTTGVTLVYYNTDGASYVKPIDGATVVDAFLKDMLGKTYNDSIYNGCIFIDNPNCGLFLNISAAMFNKQTNLEKISLTNTIVYITSSDDPIGVFSNCDNLTNANIPTYLGYYKTIKNGNTIDNTMRAIPGYYFHNCKLLENITIPDRITQIGFSAFYGCDKVETIDIPSSVTSVFSNSLLTVKRANTRYINVNGDATNKTNITFYNKCIGYNKPTTGDKTYISNSVVININNRDIVNLLGSNNVNDTSFIDNIGGGSKIYIDCRKIDGVKIGNTTTSTTKFYQGGFIGTTFETLYIGPSVTEICDFAFYNVTGTNLIINNGEVLNNEYKDNTDKNSLEVNKYPDGTYLIKTPFVKSNFNSIYILNCASIAPYALHNLYTNELKIFEPGDIYTLNNVEYTNTIALKSLGAYAFYNSNNQSGSIIIPSSVINISNTAFLQTKGSLELKCNISSYTNTYVDLKGHNHDGILVNSEFSKITFNYTGSIPENILYENKSIKSIYLGANIKTISEKAFYLCTNLTNTLSLPTNLSSIDETAFIGCTFSKFEADSSYFKTANNGMYLLTDDRTGIVLFANRHSDIQITDNTFNIDIDINTVNKICGYAFAYAFSDYANSNVYAVNIPDNIMRFGRNVFYNCQKLTRITFFPDNIASFTDESTSPKDIEVNVVNLTGISVDGSFSDLPRLKEVYIGYATDDILLSSSIPTTSSEARNNFLYNTIRNSYTNNVSDISNITIYVYEKLVETYKTGAWGLANYKISGIAKDVPPPPPVPPTGNDDSYDADIDDPEGEEWPDDGGNGDISKDEDYIPPITTEDDNTSDTQGDDWITHVNNEFEIPIRQLGTPSINVYGCRLDLLNPTYVDNHEPLTPLEIIDQFGNINFSALDYLKFNKVSTEIQYGSNNDNDGMFKLYMGDYGNNFLIVFTVTGIDNFDATTKLFTSGVEYATHRESNWLKTEIVRITKKPYSDEYYVVLLCTCLKLQNKDNYNCRSAIVSVNYGSQILDSNINNNTENTTNDEENTTNDAENTSKIHNTTKIRVIQHKTELRLSNDTREINITDLPVLFCQKDEPTKFIGNFFIGFPKNFWGTGDSIENTQKLLEYINDYFRILYDKEKIQIIGQVVTIDEIKYTYTFNVAPQKYANIKLEGSTTSKLMTFDLCRNDYPGKLDEIHEEYYYVNFEIKNKKTSLAGGVWNISIYNIGEPAEMLNINVIEDKTDIPSISVMFDGTFDVENYEGYDEAKSKYIFVDDELTANVCYEIDKLTSVRMKLALPTVVTGIPTYKDGDNTIKIYPSEELIDLCVDKSVVNTCGMSLLGNNTGNIYNAFTTKIKGNQINLGVSSNNILSNSLNNIKFVSTGAVKQSLYNYKINANNSITNRFDILQNCSRNESLIKTQRMGDSSNEILENTETYIYIIDTGYSALKTSKNNTNEPLYVNYLYIEQQQGETILNSKEVSDVNEPVHHNESSETGVYIEDNNVLTDTFYDVLAPLYRYVYENTHNDATTIEINNNVKLDNITPYFCTPYSSYCVVDNNKKLYILKDTPDSNAGIEIWDNTNKCYTCRLSQYRLNENIHVYRLYDYTINDIDDNNNFETSVSPSCGNKIGDTDYFNTIISETSVKTRRVIKIGLEIKYNGNIDISNKTVYKVVNKDGNIDFRDTSTGKLIGDIIRDAIDKSPINIKEVKTHCYFIYIDNSVDLTNGYIYAFTPWSQEDPNNKINVVLNNSSTEGMYIKYTGDSGWYQIYNVSDVNITYDATPDLNSKLNDAANAFYKNRDINQIRNNMVANINIDENKQLEAGKINITPKALSSIHQSLFRQIFYHLYYEINDNGKKIKVYDDNNNNAIMHLRMMKSYNYPPSVSFKITNIFGIQLPYELTADDTLTWKPINNSIVGSFTPIP